MNRTTSIILGIVSIILSLGSAALTVFYWLGIVITDTPHTKHGLLFAGIFVILFLFGLILVRGKGKTPA
jgi:hypothetical protein